MHILFLSHYFPPEVNAPAMRTYEHCRRWVAAGHHVTLITCTPNCPSGVVFEGYRNAWFQRETVDGIRVLGVWTYLSPNKGFLKRITNYVSYLISATLCAMTVRGVDVIVATTPQFFCGWAGVLCSWLLRRPVFLEVRRHLAGINRHGRRNQEPPRAPLARMAGNQDVRGRAADRDGWRRVSRTLAGPGRSEGKDRRCSERCRHAAVRSTSSLFPVQRHCAGPGKFVCAYIGTVGMAHGLDVVLRAAERLKVAGRTNVEFRIVGDGADRQELRCEAVSRGLENVIFAGLVPKSAHAGNDRGS